MSEDSMWSPAAKEEIMMKQTVDTLTIDGELSRYKTRDLKSSYKNRLAAHGLLPETKSVQWQLPAQGETRISEAAKEIYGDPETWVASNKPIVNDEHPNYLTRHAWTFDGFEDLPVEEQRRIAPPQPDHERCRFARAEGAKTERSLNESRIPGAETVDDRIQVRRARPQTAPALPKKDAHATAAWRAKHDFTFYTPSDDPKELAMHKNFQDRQGEKLKKHQREVEMRTALTGWAVRRARIDEEIVRRQEAVNWSVRAHSAAPKQRVLDVHAGEDDDGIFSDESDTEFAAEEAPLGSPKSFGRSPSRGATWLSSYHEKSFHRIEYTKPKPEPRRAPTHRPMYVQRPESAATDVGGRPGSAFLAKKPNSARDVAPTAGDDEEGEVQAAAVVRTPRIINIEEKMGKPMSSLPTKARPMSATEYRKQLIERNTQLGRPAVNKLMDIKPQEDPKAPPLLQMLAPPPDMEWKKDQMDFRVAQCAEVQGVREAFIRQGKHVSMKTIERALSVPNERTFAECMAALCKSGQGLPSDPSVKKKKKGKKKKKKK